MLEAQLSGWLGWCSTEGDEYPRGNRILCGDIVGGGCRFFDNDFYFRTFGFASSATTATTLVTYSEPGPSMQMGPTNWILIVIVAIVVIAIVVAGWRILLRRRASPIPKPIPPPPEAEVEKQIYCIHCGKALPVGSKFCYYCAGGELRRPS